MGLLENVANQARAEVGRFMSLPAKYDVWERDLQTMRRASLPTELVGHVDQLLVELGNVRTEWSEVSGKLNSILPSLQPAALAKLDVLGGAWLATTAVSTVEGMGHVFKASDSTGNAVQGLAQATGLTRTGMSMGVGTLALLGVAAFVLMGRKRQRA